MTLAIFGIENTAINLAVTLAILCLVALWLALIVFTFTDARRRIADPFLIGCATAASLFPFIGTIVYTILRPAEFLEDAHEREVETRASEIRTRHLEANSCHKCGFPTEHDFMRCPSCRTRLKEECPTCSKPVGLDWKLCPYCETALVAPPKRSSRSGSSKASRGSSKPSSKSSRSKEPIGEETRREEPKRSSRRPAKDSSGRSSGQPSGRSSSGSSGTSGSTKSRSTSGRKTSSGTRSDETQESPGPRSSSDPDATQESRRTTRSARRKTIVPDEDGQTKPINSGDTPAPSRSPEPR